MWKINLCRQGRRLFGGTGCIEGRLGFVLHFVGDIGKWLPAVTVLLCLHVSCIKFKNSATILRLIGLREVIVVEGDADLGEWVCSHKLFLFNLDSVRVGLIWNTSL
jgi:hypothetical protein